MNLNEYMEWTRKTVIYPAHRKVEYPLVALAGETGEILNKVKKVMRGGPNDPKSYDEIREDVLKELGDALYYLARAADDYGYSLDAIAQENRNKLEGRLEAGTLSGSGEGVDRNG